MAKEPRNLSGSVVAITGAARGIGRATAAALVREGARVAIGDLDVELARRTASELGGGTQAFELNVADRGSFARFLEQVESQLGPVDVLVNNAGIMPVGLFLDEDDASAARQIDINLHGVVFGCKLALPGMLSRGRGHIVNIASSAGKAGIPGIATYSATKHAVVGLSEAIRAETFDTPIEVTVVMPGVVNTELQLGVKRLRGLKTVEPEDVADAIVAALRVPRFEVYVPKAIGGLNRFATLVPRKASETILRALGADKLMLDIDERERARYEERAARSEPGREPEAPDAAATAEKPAAGDPARPAEKVEAAP